MNKIIFTSLFILSFSVVAEESCYEIPNTLERSQCHDHSIKKLDNHLNSEYKDAITALKDPNSISKITEEELRASQRLWLKFIESDCSVKGSILGGTDIWKNIEYLTCKEKYYIDRINLFKVISGKIAP